MKVSIEMALLYNFQDTERVRKVKQALLCMGVRSKVVAPEDFTQPLGSLVGLLDTIPEEKLEAAGLFTEEMLVLYRFTSRRIDELLRRLQKAGAGQIPYKAVITQENVNWNGVQLIEELKREHAAMQNGQTAHM